MEGFRYDNVQSSCPRQATIVEMNGTVAADVRPERQYLASPSAHHRPPGGHGVLDVAVQAPHAPLIRYFVKPFEAGDGFPDLGHTNTSSAYRRSAAAMRASAIATYSGSISIPMKLKPSSAAPRPVLPEPVKGSSTVPPGGVTSRQR